LRYLKGDLPRLFGNSMREFALSIGKKNFLTFGEVLDGNAEADIARFIGRNTSDATDLVGVDAALDYPLFNNLKPVVKGFSAPATLASMFQLRKTIERDILSSHGDATRYFVTFLDNHDMKERIRYEDPLNPSKYDDQVTLGLACLFALPGIPCVYYGTEQGLHGHGSDPAVREALWGGPGFDPTSTFFEAIQQIARTRSAQSALRYGRFYFRPVSGDGRQFSVSPFPQGVLAFSRILNDQEVLLVANANSTQNVDLDVIIEIALSAEGDSFGILYSNRSSPTNPGTVRAAAAGTVAVNEPDGSTGSGPLHALRLHLEPLEVQILRKRS
jgi:glycosidase